MKKALIYIKNNLIISGNNVYLVIGLLIDINNIITGSNLIILRKFNARPYGCEKMYLDKDLVEDELYQLKDQLNKRKINHRDFYFVLLNNRHPFYEGMPQLYNHIRFFLSVVNRMKMENLIHNRTIKKCFSFYKKRIFLIFPLASTVLFYFSIFCF